MAIDAFRNIHKLIRAELFTFSTDLGRADVSTPEGARTLAARFHELVELLEHHAVHEDTYFTPLIVHQAPDLGERLMAQHRDYDRRLSSIDRVFSDLWTMGREVRVRRAHELYIELSDFISAYLLHMQSEEKDGNRALAEIASDEELIALHTALVRSLPESELVRTMRGIFSHTNPSEHLEMLAGAQAGPPGEFEAVSQLAQSVLSPAEWKALLGQLGRAAA